MKIGNTDISKLYIGSTEVTKAYLGSTVVYEKSGPAPIEEIPLTFEIQSAGVIRWKATNTGITRTIEYSKNGGEWTSITSATGSSAPSISVVRGDTIQLRGNNTAYGTSSINYNSFSGTTCSFSAKGNIMSLINSTNFKDISTISSTYCFSYLFYNCTGLTDTSELLLPATTLSNYCYYAMFFNCSGLTQAPKLPATTLAESCYGSIFNGCTSLTGAPSILPATALANSCYSNMFSGCRSLTTAPELPATTLTPNCYNRMFLNCSNLNYVKCLATDISADSCTYNWVSGVASTGTFVKAASMSSWTTGNNGIPSGWTIVNA